MAEVYCLKLAYTIRFCATIFSSSIKSVPAQLSYSPSILGYYFHINIWSLRRRRSIHYKERHIVYNIFICLDGVMAEFQSHDSPFVLAMHIQHSVVQRKDRRDAPSILCLRCVRSLATLNGAHVFRLSFCRRSTPIPISVGPRAAKPSCVAVGQPRIHIFKCSTPRIWYTSVLAISCLITGM